jgi:hypothetical protein
MSSISALDFYDKNMHGKSSTNHYDRSVCYNLIAECLRRGAGRILMATDLAGVNQAAVFTVGDHRTAYYFMSTRTLDSMNGATSLLIWTAIQHAAARGLTFDMDMLHVRNKRLSNLLLLTGFGRHAEASLLGAANTGNHSAWSEPGAAHETKALMTLHI